MHLTGDNHDDGHGNIVGQYSIIAPTTADATRELTARGAGRSGLFIQQRTRTTAAAAHAIVVVVVGVVVVVIRHGTDRNRASVGINRRSMPGWPTDVVEYGRLNRRYNSIQRPMRCVAMRCGAVRCNEPEGRTAEVARVHYGLRR